MAKIAKIDPVDWKNANIVQLDIDASNNMEAIEALDQWASENGFARVRENFLRIVIPGNGRRVFRGACYRITAEERDAVTYEMDQIAKRAQKTGVAVKDSK